jgi:hypothetical protein
MQAASAQHGASKGTVQEGAGASALRSHSCNGYTQLSAASHLPGVPGVLTPTAGPPGVRTFSESRRPAPTSLTPTALGSDSLLVRRRPCALGAGDMNILRAVEKEDVTDSLP